jgi:hypothetical protein
MHTVLVLFILVSVNSEAYTPGIFHHKEDSTNTKLW